MHAARAVCLGLLALLAVQPSVGAGGHPQVWIWSDPGQPSGPALAEEAGGVLDWLQGRGVAAHLYPNLDMVAFEAPGRVAWELERQWGGRIDPATPAELHLDRSLPYIRAEEVREDVGPARGGPSVLVVDTGVDSAHPDFQEGNLAANVQAERAGGLVLGSIEQLPVVDAAGHGTHVAGIVAGSGEALGEGDPLNGRYSGVYSTGRIVGYQAATPDQDEEEIGVDIVAALEAFDWAITNRARFDIRTVSNSWGVLGDFDAGHPVNQATQRLYLRGMVVVFSAGNSGEDGAGTLNSYCQAPWVLCVAAGDLDGQRMGFSSYGRSGADAAPYDHPDLTAPGLAIHSANAVSQASPVRGAGSLLDGEPVSEELYADRSGTSMAAPHVAGAAALLQAARPDLSPDQVMDILVAAARPMTDDVAKAGAGYLDVASAYAIAQEAAGNRAAFLAGREVKYAGPATGDADYANDPVSVGYEGAIPPSALRFPGRDDPWAATPAAWLLLGAAALLVLGGIGWRGRKAGAGAGATGM